MSANVKSQILNQNAQPITTGAANDTVAPLSFQIWYKTRQGIIPGKEYIQYNSYLTSWYNTQKQTTSTTKEQTKLSYLKLLRQLQLFLTNEETENWYNNVDLNNEKELLLAIPYFAKKLRDISLYYNQLRKEVKQTRIRYNLGGTNAGLSQELYTFLLSKFTQNSNKFISIPSYIWQNIPALSSVKNTIKFEIEELYDTHNYLDHSPTVPVSSYYDVNDPKLHAFLTTKNLELTSIDWIYKLGTYSLSGNNNFQLQTKYLGQEKFITTAFPVQSSVANFFNINIEEGNNFLYWPTGPYLTITKDLPRFTPLPLTATDSSTLGTGGSSLELSDTIFVKTVNGITGAWLRNSKFDTKETNINADFRYNTKTVFRYPFPGYGLSADDIDWTGYELSPTFQFNYLSTENQKAIENAYWSTNFPAVTTTIPIYVNQTSLISQGAHPDRNYTHADKIRTWSTVPDYSETTYNGTINEAWLYRHDNTEISIKSNTTNVVLWPYGTIDPETFSYDFLPDNLTDICAPVSLSSIEWRFSTASDSISSADILYKIINFKDTPETATECFWLSGTTITDSKNGVTCIAQPSLNLICRPGEFTNFVWLGDDETDVNQVFKTYEHEPGCKFITTPNTNYNDHPLCTCRQVQFTPFGHAGSNFIEYNQHADFIVEDANTNQYFDINTWRDTENKNAQTSTKFAWYRTTNTHPTPYSFGPGVWVATSVYNTQEKFKLKYGKVYRYYRSKPRTKDIETGQFPYLVVRHDYNNWPYRYGKQFVWVKGVKTPQNTWTSTVTAATTHISPGDLLLYTRRDTNTFTVSGTRDDYTKITENKNSAWSSFDYVTIDPDGTSTLIYLSVPSLGTRNILYSPSLSSANNFSQYPVIPSDTYFSVKQWEIQHEYEPGLFVSHLFKETPFVTFTPGTSGLFYVSVTAVTATTDFDWNPIPINNKKLGRLKTVNQGTSGYWYFDNIPPITAVSLPIAVPTLSTIETEIPGFVLYTPLFGWNYNLHLYDGVSQGAKPYWAVGYTEKDISTDFKGVESWGVHARVVDEHNVLTAPLYSNLQFESGNRFEYTRNFTTDLKWTQPITLKIFNETNTWCELSTTTVSSTNFSSFLKNFNQEIFVTPTTNISPIQLTNIVDNEPVEIYYNALNPFTWSVTATPYVQPTTISQASAGEIISPVSPWANLGNQTYPTVAHASTLESLYSKYKLGGFFVPANLGISKFVAEDYSVTLSLCSEQLSGIFENKAKKVGGRGFTKQDQVTPYKTELDDVTWMKQTTPGSPAAGNIRPEVFKKYQKFIPYNSLSETNPYGDAGLVTTMSRQSPWTGKDDTDWGDFKNYPINFNGEINVDKWADTQILKQNKLRVDNWVTDIYGNQYGLYKNLSGVSVTQAREIPGEIWVRKKSQAVEPGAVALKDVFDNVKTLNMYSQLTGSGITKIDMFFDSLYIETSGYVIFEKIDYDFSNERIYSTIDNTRILSLEIPVQTNLQKKLNASASPTAVYSKPGDTWFFPDKKEVCLSVCGVSGTNIYPEIYKLNLVTLSFNKIFPIGEDVTAVNQLSSLGLTQIGSPILSYNSLLNEYILAVRGTTPDFKTYIVQISINDLETHTLKNITVYTPFPDEVLPPTLTAPPNTTVTVNSTITYQITGTTTTCSFQALATDISWGNLNSQGTFTGTPDTVGLYSIPFTVSNEAGETYHTLTINVIE